jgi:peptide deformylase
LTSLVAIRNSGRMARLPLVYLPDPLLREVSTAFERVDDDVRRLADDMFDTMYGKRGLGLAGVQVGVTKRIVVLDVADTDDDEVKNPITMINPRILTSSDARNVHEEGCLSMPDFRCDVERPAQVKVSFLDRNGREQTLAADGLLATAIQHEIDHLDGRLIIDSLSRLRRDMVIRKFRKLAKAGELG